MKNHEVPAVGPALQFLLGVAVAETYISRS